VLSKLDYADSTKNVSGREALEKAKRLFASEVQKVLDPRSRDAEFRKLLDNVSGQHGGPAV
jgi:hypothetical protein